MPAKTSSQKSAVFEELRTFINRFSFIPTDSDRDLIALWVLGTWTFAASSPASPDTYPYLYVTGGKGSGKSTLGLDVFSYVCRNHKQIVQTTGATLFRTIGTYDEESGEVINHYPTLSIDEIDAAYGSGGSNDESMRGIVNAGYRRGGVVQRSAKKGTIDFPVYCPKAFLGIDNGRLPDTIVDRCIRILLKVPTPEQMRQVEPLLRHKVEDGSAELKQELANWANDNAMVFRDYEPKEMLDILSPRQWEIVRPLLQLAYAVGIESRIRKAIVDVFTRKAQVTSGKAAMYKVIFNLLEDQDDDKVTGRQIFEALELAGVRVPGDSQTGLGRVLSTDGICGKPLRLPEGHPGRTVAVRRNGKKTDKTEDQPVQRGFMRYQFDDAFMEHVLTDDDDQ